MPNSSVVGENFFEDRSQRHRGLSSFFGPRTARRRHERQHYGGVVCSAPPYLLLARHLYGTNKSLRCRKDIQLRRQQAYPILEKRQLMGGGVWTTQEPRRRETTPGVRKPRGADSIQARAIHQQQRAAAPTSRTPMKTRTHAAFELRSPALESKGGWGGRLARCVVE